MTPRRGALLAAGGRCVLAAASFPGLAVWPPPVIAAGREGWGSVGARPETRHPDALSSPAGTGSRGPGPSWAHSKRVGCRRRWGRGASTAPACVWPAEARPAGVRAGWCGVEGGSRTAQNRVTVTCCLTKGSRKGELSRGPQLLAGAFQERGVPGQPASGGCPSFSSRHCDSSQCRGGRLAFGALPDFKWRFCSELQALQVWRSRPRASHPESRGEESAPAAQCPVCGLAAPRACQRREVAREFSSCVLDRHPGIQPPNVLLVQQ